MMKSKFRSYFSGPLHPVVLLMVIFLIVLPLKSESQSLPGTTGYFNIPSAEIYPDRTMYFGTNLLNKKYLKWGNPDYHAMDFFVTATYLPFAEVSVRFTRKIDMPEAAYESTVGDRMMSARIQILKETKDHPAILVGFQNFFSTLSTGEASHFNSTYLVAAKNFELPSVTKNIGVSMGYGSDIFTSSDYQFIGLFGGISITPEHFDFLELMLEYDAERWNAGARVTILRHIVVLAGFEGMDAFSGGISYRFRLP